MPVLRRTAEAKHQAKVEQLKEQLREERAQSTFMEENLRVLELEMAGDAEWRRMGMALRTEFTRAGLDDITDASRAMYLVNPLIQRAVNVATYYTWAQGYEFQADDDKVQTEVVDPLFADTGNQLDLFSHQAVLLTDVDQQVDGNNFQCLFTEDDGTIHIRTIPSEQVREIITDNDDYATVMYYKRVWSEQIFSTENGSYTAKLHTVYYPDIRYDPADKPDQIGSYEVKWDAPIVHLRTGGFKSMRFGVPQTFAALDWARAYKKFLEDWHTIVSSLARFAWKASTKGRKVQRLKNKLGNPLRTLPDSEMTEQAEPNPSDRPPVPGSVFVGATGDDLVPINKSGTTTSADDAKASRLMVASAMDLPDTILSGDPQQGNLATAKTLDRPTELYMVSRQQMWADHMQAIFSYAYSRKVKAGAVPGRLDKSNDMLTIEAGLDTTVETVFPPILEHDVLSTVQAIVAAATLSGYADAGTMPRETTAQLLMSSLGVEDIDQALKDLPDEVQADVAAAVERLAEALGD